VNQAAAQIVEEALANARLFAGGAPVTVLVRYDAEAVELRVANARGSPWNGRGKAHALHGMRDHARCCGGSLEAGPDGRGGFIVRARLPREPAGA
jgi:signal transduction histidine kinase